MTKHPRLIKFFKSVMAEIAPDRYSCIYCDAELYEPTRSGACPACAADLPFVGAAACIKCGKPFLPEGADRPQPVEFDGEVGWLDAFEAEDGRFAGYCGMCRNHTRHFDRVRSVFAYQGAPRRAIYRLKYGNARYLAPYMAGYLSDLYLDDVIPVDMVVAVPLHRDRRRQRGYNQADLIARNFAERLRLPYVPEALTKVRKTLTQTSLSLKERQENLEGAFAADKALVAGKNVLVIDDVLTTGATMSEAAHTLKRAGAVHVYGMTVANVAER